MIAKWPSVIPADTLSQTSWYFADVLPTLADIVGHALPQEVDGLSILPSLQGKAQKLSERYLYWEFHERGFQQAARKGDWKAIRLAPEEPLELYHLLQDPGEQYNVAEKFPDIVADFESYLQTARKPSVDWPVD